MNPALLVGAGFLLGTVGVKALKSEPAKKVMVQAAVHSLRAKEEAETLIDQAKAEFDDIMAQADYEKQLSETTAEAATEASGTALAVPAVTETAPAVQAPAETPAAPAQAASVIPAAAPAAPAQAASVIPAAAPTQATVDPTKAVADAAQSAKKAAAKAAAKSAGMGKGMGKGMGRGMGMGRGGK